MKSNKPLNFIPEKRTRLMILCGALAFATVSQSLGEESAFLRELKQLDKQRDDALVGASAPVYRRYQASLEQLLRRATQGNDLEAALKIKEALKAIPGSDASVKTAPQTFTISSSDQKGTLVGSATKGQKITVQYIEGQWSYASAIPVASPDQTPVSFVQLAIYGVTKGNTEKIIAVPLNTKARPFSQSVPKDYEEILLRMNDSNFSDNSGSVTYKASIK